MADLAGYGIDIDTLRTMYREWRDGATKSELERRYLNAPQAHGKLFSSLMGTHLGLETERRSSLADRVAELQVENDDLRRLLRQHGIDPQQRPGTGNP